MPSEKRQRQDEGRLNRRVEMAEQAKKGQRRRQTRALVILLGVLLAGAFLWSVFAGGGDDDDPVATSDSSTSVPVDDSTPDTTADSVVDTDPGDPAVGTSDCAPTDGSGERQTQFESGPRGECIDVTKTYTAEVVTSRGAFTVELDAAAAPKTVNSFVFLARHKYYDGVAFHRIIPGFVVQGGDAVGEPPGTGGPGYEFADELPTGEAPYYEIGSLAMANSGADTNGSQFFVVTGDNGANLPASYSLFGQVTEGMDVVMAIEATGTPEGTPSEETTIESVTITES